MIKLANGQVWQQSEHFQRYHYAYMPEVTIYRSGNVRGANLRSVR